MEKIYYDCGPLRVDPANRRLTRSGGDVALEPKAFAVLVALLERADALVTRDELLDVVWGHRHITPATLNRVMALLRRALEDDADHPRLIHTVHGAGYRFIGAVRRVAESREASHANFGPPPAARLPAKLEALVGRERELDQLNSMLVRHRAVTIIGAGGMGKTQCALECGRLCASRFPDGVWFFDLSPLERVQEWLMTLSASLSVPAAGTSQPLVNIAKALSGRKALLVIDNCDRLATEVGAILLMLLRSCPELHVLATSQRRLDFVGEHLMWMPPLQLPPPAADARRLSLEEVAASPAVALLLARVAAVQPAFALTASNVGDIVEICHRLDGMPLALELVAAQFAMLSPAAIRERLHERFSLLTSDSAGREPRHQTMHALVGWSYGLLSDQEQRLLCWLSVFLQGWTIDAAEQAGRALGIEDHRLLELHSGLIMKSLVAVDPSLAPPRYRLLESVREFALQVLRTSGEEAAAKNAHLQHFVQLAEHSHREILDQHSDEWVERLRHEHANIDAALAWARSGAADARSALQLAGSLTLYAKCHGQNWLMTVWADRALQGAVPESSTPYVRALLCSGLFRLYVQDPAIESRLRDVIALAAPLGDRWAHACACAYLAMWNANLGRLEQARDYARTATDSARAQVDDWLRSLAGLAEAWIAIREGEHQRALDTLEPLRHVSFDLHQHQMVDACLALTHYRVGHWQCAAALALDLFDLAVRTDNLRAQGGALEVSAYLAMRAARPETSARMLGKATDIRERSRAPLFSFWLAPHDDATYTLRALLGAATFDALLAAGALARDENAVEEARAMLRQLLTDQAPTSSPA